MSAENQPKTEKSEKVEPSIIKVSRCGNCKNFSPLSVSQESGGHREILGLCKWAGTLVSDSTFFDRKDGPTLSATLFKDEKKVQFGTPLHSGNRLKLACPGYGASK